MAKKKTIKAKQKTIKAKHSLRAQKPAEQWDDKWERLAEEVISQAERVKCSLDEFAEGLHVILYAVEDRYKLARDEADHQDYAKDEGE